MNPWTRDRVPDAFSHPMLGAWLNRYKLASAPFVLGERYRLALEGLHPFWYTFPRLTLASRATDRATLTVTAEFYPICILGQATQAIAQTGSYRARVFQAESQPGARDGYKFTQIPVDQLNFAQLASGPALLRRTMLICADTQITAEITNLATAQNIVSLCIFGYST